LLPLFKSKSRAKAKLCIPVRQDLKEEAEKLGIDIDKFLELLIDMLSIKKAICDLTDIIEMSEIYFKIDERKSITEEAQRILKEAAESAESKLRKLSQTGPVDTSPSEN